MRNVNLLKMFKATNPDIKTTPTQDMPTIFVVDLEQCHSFKQTV